MANKLQIKRGSNRTIPILADGELAFCKDTAELYIGNKNNNTLLNGINTYTATVTGSSEEPLTNSICYELDVDHLNGIPNDNSQISFLLDNIQIPPNSAKYASIKINGVPNITNFYRFDGRAAASYAPPHANVSFNENGYLKFTSSYKSTGSETLYRSAAWRGNNLSVEPELNTQYTLIYNITKNTFNSSAIFKFGGDSTSSIIKTDCGFSGGMTGLYKTLITTRSDNAYSYDMCFNVANVQTIGAELEIRVMLLKGDYRNSAISNEYWEGVSGIYYLYNQNSLEKILPTTQYLRKWQQLNIVLNKDNAFSSAGKTMLDLTYPVGSIYISVNNADPGILFGGSWQPFANGRTLVGIDKGTHPFSSVENVGGTMSHTLTTEQMPRHTHTMHDWSIITSEGGNTGIYTMPAGTVQTTSNRVQTNAKQNLPTGGGQSHNNLQPYIIVYMFKRIS